MIEKAIQNKKFNLLAQNMVQKFVLNSNYRIPLMRKLKVIFRNIIKEEVAELVDQKYKDCYCIFSRYGLGDVFFVAGKIKEFKKTHAGKVVYFTEKQKLVPFIKAFPSVDEVVCIKELSCLQEIHCTQQNIEKEKLLPLFYPYRGEKETEVFADNYANMLGISKKSEIECPVISGENYNNAKKEFERLNINPQNTIVIIPEAVMFDYRVISKQRWVKFANKLTSLGYDVVFNTTDKAYKNFKTTFLPVMDFLAFLKMVKHTFSFRSGINDVMVGMNMNNITAIYPPHLEVIWADPMGLYFHNIHHKKLFDNEFDNIFHIYSLNSNFQRNDIAEIIYNFNYDKFEYSMLKCLE